MSTFKTNYFCWVWRELPAVLTENHLCNGWIFCLTKNEAMSNHHSQPSLVVHGLELQVAGPDLPLLLD